MDMFQSADIDDVDLFYMLRSMRRQPASFADHPVKKPLKWVRILWVNLRVLWLVSVSGRKLLEI
jgi:hypothetical protein